MIYKAPKSEWTESGRVIALSLRAAEIIKVVWNYKFDHVTLTTPPNRAILQINIVLLLRRKLLENLDALSSRSAEIIK